MQFWSLTNVLEEIWITHIWNHKIKLLPLIFIPHRQNKYIIYLLEKLSKHTCDDQSKENDGNKRLGGGFRGA